VKDTSVIPVLWNTSGNCRRIAPIINGHRRGGNCFQNALAKLEIPSTRDRQGWVSVHPRDAPIL
jgi:hypothetical protein